MHMREAVALYDDVKNLTWPPNGILNGVFGLQIDILALCSLSIITNALVIVISIAIKAIGNYKFFLSNLSVCEILFSTSVIGSMISKHIRFVENYPTNVIICSLETKPMYALGFCTIFALPLASINRYLTIVHHNDYYFTRSRIIFVCMLAYIPLLYPIIDFSFAQHVTDSPDCRYTLFTKFLPEVLVLPCIIGYAILVYCNFKLIIALRIQFKSVSTVVKMSKTTVVNEKSILIATFLQAAVPIICTMPMAVSLICVMIDGWRDAYAMNLRAGPVSINENRLASTMLLLNPLCNSLITLVVVKQYRTSLLDCARKIRTLFVRSNNVHAATNMEMTISPHSVRPRRTY